MSEYDLIVLNVTKHITLSESQKAHFLSLLKTESIPRKREVLKEGEPCTKISFVCSGALRAYYQDKDLKQSTIMFALADWWITDINCFVNKLPAALTIEAIEDSVVIHLEKKDMDNLLVEIPIFEKFFRIVFQNAYVREQVRTIQNLSLSAEERYRNFLLKYPQVARRVAQKQIASYLGFTPEFLSALRKRMK